MNDVATGRHTESRNKVTLYLNGVVNMEEGEVTDLPLVFLPLLLNLSLTSLPAARFDVQSD